MQEVLKLPKLSLEELMRKIKKRPDGNFKARGMSQVISTKKKTHSKQEFKILGIGRNMGGSPNISKLSLGPQDSKFKSMFDKRHKGGVNDMDSLSFEDRKVLLKTQVRTRPSGQLVEKP